MSRRAPRQRPDPLVVRLVLSVLGRTQGVMRLLSVNPAHVLELVRLRLILDLRPRPHDQRNGMIGAGLLATCGLFLFMGLFGALTVILVPTSLWALSLTLAFILLWLTLTLVMEYSERLLDTSDVSLVLPAPVSDASLLFARVVHIAAHVSILLACISLPALVAGCWRFPPLVWIPLFVLSAGLIGVLSLTLLVTVFLVTMRTIGPSRFKSVAAWLQMFMVLSIYSGFYVVRPLLAPLFDRGLLEQRELWLLLFPPAWFGGLLELALGAHDGVTLSLALTALVAPLLLLALALRLSRGIFSATLAASAEASGQQTLRNQHSSLAGTFGEWFTRPGPERAGWHFLPAMARRDHRFQMRVFPMFAMLAAMTGYYVLDGRLESALALSMPIYGLIPALMVVLESARWGGQPGARWLFDVAPLAHAGGLLAGMYKSILLLVVVLPAVLYTALIGWAYGAEGWRQCAFSLNATLLVCILCLFLTPLRLPFSAPFRKQGTGTVLLMWITMAVAGGVGFIHAFVATDATVQVVTQAVLLLTLIIAWRALGRRNLPWPDDAPSS